MIKYTECCLDNLYVLDKYCFDKLVDETSKKLFEIEVGCYLASNKRYLTGKEFKFLRKTAGLKKRKFAELTGISDYKLNRIEMGAKFITPPLKLLLKLIFLDRFDRSKLTSIQDFLTENSELPSYHPSEKLVFEYSPETGWNGRLSSQSDDVFLVNQRVKEA